eukprot:Skav235613  [mRNA]  locus=scaffold358:59911:66549:+ [translate_table: standard]
MVAGRVLWLPVCRYQELVVFSRPGTATYHVDSDVPELLTEALVGSHQAAGPTAGSTAAGVGRTQYKLLLICGLTFCSDAAEALDIRSPRASDVLSLEHHELTNCSSAWSAAVSSELQQLILSSEFSSCGELVAVVSCSSFVAALRAFLLSSAVITIFGFATALSLPVGFDILAEALPGESRGVFLMYIENLIAWGMLEQYGWRVFTAMAALPTLIASIAGALMLPESPRWLVDMDREDEAARIVQKWAKDNGEPMKIGQPNLGLGEAVDRREQRPSERSAAENLSTFQRAEVFWTSAGGAPCGGRPWRMASCGAAGAFCNDGKWKRKEPGIPN